MISNPYLPSPTHASAWDEGFIKGFVAQSSPQPSDKVGPDDVEAFNEGVQAGVDAQSTGLMFAAECVPASESTEDSEILGHALEGVEALGGLWRAVDVAKLAAGLEAGVVSFCLFLIIAPVGTQPPERVLPTLGQPVADTLSTWNVGSIELFCGVGFDATAHDCEYKISPLFLREDQALSAAQAMNRNAWLVVSWRTDQCNSFKIVQSNG